MAINIFLLYGIFSFVIGSLSMLGNMMNLIVFYKVRSLRSTPSNNIIIALTINDFLYGIFIVVFSGIPYSFMSSYPYGEIGCMISACIQHLFVVGNLLLLAISIDRILLISLQYTTYLRFQTTFRVSIAIAMCYAAGLLLILTESALWNRAKTIPSIASKLNFEAYCYSPSRNLKEFGLMLSFGFYVTPVLIIFTLNGIFVVLLIRRIRKQNKIGNTANPQNANPPFGEINKSRYKKAAITLGVLVAAMGISNIPYCVHVITSVFCKTCTNSPILVRIWSIINQLNCLMDPLFYGLTQKKIRDFYRKTFTNGWDTLELST